MPRRRSGPKGQYGRNGEEKISCLYREYNPGSSVEPVA
jgi:hypothetical protein